MLAQKVLLGKTKGYRNHPELARFWSHPDPPAAIASYLRAVHHESMRRGYAFDVEKIERKVSRTDCLHAGPALYEWEHLRKKLKGRDPERYRDLPDPASVEAHPLFAVVDGEREPWESAVEYE